MKQAGQIALMPFPYTDLSQSKRRPVLLLKKLDSTNDDWLVCMISSQLHQYAPELDWQITPDDIEFGDTGLKVASVFRLSRVAVLDGQLLLGQLGHVSKDRLRQLKVKFSHWLVDD
jgi:mRNA interferase MazF